MPHDKHGTEIAAGDGVVFAGWDGKHKVGVIAAVSPRAETCNVTIATPMLGGCEMSTLNADMCVVVTRDGIAVKPPYSAAINDPHVHQSTATRGQVAG